jgi:hypothetical protein
VSARTEFAIAPAADAVIALTPSTARMMRGDGIPVGRVHVIPPVVGVYRQVTGPGRGGAGH